MDNVKKKVMGSGKHERCHNSLQNGGNIISIYGAAKQYNVPRMTLSDRIHGKVSTDPIVGHPTVLSKEEEDSMVNYIKYMHERKFICLRT